MSRLLKVSAVSLFAAACLAGAAKSTVHQVLTYPSTGACAKAITGLNDCIASASDGATITVKPGTYFEYGSVIGHAVTLKGSCGSTIIDATQSGLGVYTYDALDVHSSNVTISCITFRHANYGINDTGGYTNLTATSNTFTGLYYSIGLAGGADNFDIEKNKFLGTDEVNIALDPANTHVPNDDGKIIGNTFNNGYYDGVESRAASDNLMITGNKFLNLDDNGIDYGFSGYPLTNSTISANTFTNNWSPIVLSAGSDGDTVSSNTFSGVISSNKAAIEIHGNDATVTGNSFPTAEDGSAIYISGGLATVTKNAIKGGTDDYGIEVSGAGPYTVTGNTLGGGFGNDGIYVACSSTCDGSVVSKNTVNDVYSGSDGLNINDAGACATGPACFTISNNTVTAATNYGFEINVGFSTVSGNKAANSGAKKETSAYYINGSANTISTNTATNNAWDGFSILGANNALTSNTATGNGLDGFDIGEPAHAANATATTLNKNTASKNNGDGIRVYDSGGTNSITVTNSKVSGSGGKDCVVHDFTSLNVAGSTGNVCKDGSNFTVLEYFAD